MRKFLFFTVSSVVAATPATPAMAQDIVWGDRRITSDADIVVTATREPTPVAEIGQAVSVVTREEIERTQAVTAADVLSRLPGVSVAPSGGFGQPASVFVRGADNAQSLVLIDGVRINDPADVGGGFDFGALTLGQFDRVEVVRGSQAVLWGSRAIGGVINFITARPTEAWAVRAEGEYGYRDQKRLGGSASGLVGPVGLTLGGQWLQGDGISAYSEDRGATEKDGFESTSANARAQVDLVGGLSADAGGYFTRATYGYDGFGADALNEGEKRDALGYANLRYGNAAGTLSARVGYGLTDTHRVSDDAVFGPYATDGRNERIEGQVGFAPVAAARVLVGAEHERSEFQDNYGSNDSAEIDSVFATLTVRPVAGLTVVGGARYDDHSQFGDRTTFSANGAWQLAGAGGPVLRASWGQGFKAPSLYQLYTNGTFNPLEAETSDAWDVGIEQPFADGHGAMSLTWFDRRTENLIDYDFATWSYFNIGKTSAKGLELGFKVMDWNGFSASLAYTYLDAVNELTGKRLARRPENNFAASLDYATAFGLSVGAALRHGGSRFDDAANLSRVGEHTVVDLRAAMPVGDALEVFGRVENVLDEHYEVVRTYGTPGRSAYAGIRVRL